MCYQGLPGVPVVAQPRILGSHHMQDIALCASYSVISRSRISALPDSSHGSADMLLCEEERERREGRWMRVYCTTCVVGHGPVYLFGYPRNINTP